MQSIRRSWFSGRRLERNVKSEEKWEAVRDSRREGSWKIQFRSYFYTATVTVLRWRKVSMKQKLWIVNLNPVKCGKIFGEISYLLFIFACSLLREKSCGSQRVLKKSKLWAREGGTFCNKCSPSSCSSTQNSCSGFRADMYFTSCKYYKNTWGKKSPTCDHELGCSRQKCAVKTFKRQKSLGNIKPVSLGKYKHSLILTGSRTKVNISSFFYVP